MVVVGAESRDIYHISGTGRCFSLEDKQLTQFAPYVDNINRLWAFTDAILNRQIYYTI